MTEIVLIEPGEGAQTPPTQAHTWPLDEDTSDHPRTLLPIRWDALDIVSVDRTRPRPVRFEWAPVPVAGGAARYMLRVARSASMEHARIVRDLNQPRAEVYHLHLRTRYHWDVTAWHGRRAVAKSPVASFVTSAEPPRWIHVPEITNVRDLGGWRLSRGGVVRQGLVYRSSEMNDRLAITEEGKRVLLDELGIRTDIDLRQPGEGRGSALDPERVRWTNIPILPYAGVSSDGPMGQDAYRKVFQTLADPAHYPVLFHCLGGADRAGTVAFLLGAALGMRVEDLFQDYELTSLSVWGERFRFSVEFMSLLAALKPFSADPADLHGQVENYLLSIGVLPREIASLRSHLTESA